MGYSLSDSETLLKKAIIDLDRAWLTAGSSWKDKAREDFDAEHLEQLRQAVENERRGMRNIDQLLRQVIRECS